MLTEKQIEISKITKLSPNFTLFELINSSSYPNLVEWPSNEIIRKLTEFAETILQPIRDKWGAIRINSGYRNTEINDKVGGVPNSVHKIFHDNEYIGVASDIVPVNAKLEDVFEWAYENLPELKTIIIYRKKSVTKAPFLHLDTRVNREKGVKMEKISAGKYVYI